MVDIPERTAATSVSANVGALASSTREGYSAVSVLLGYDSVFHDRTGYTSVQGNVAVAAYSTREGYVGSSILLEYGDVYHDRTGYAGVMINTTIPMPITFDLLRTQRGWGTPLRGPHIIRLVMDATAGETSVQETVTMGAPTPEARDAFATVSEGDVVVPA